MSGEAGGSRAAPLTSATEAWRDRLLRHEGLQVGIELRQDAEGLGQTQMLFVVRVAVVGDAEVLPGEGQPFGAGFIAEGAHEALVARLGGRAEGDVALEDFGAGVVTGEFLLLN